MKWINNKCGSVPCVARILGQAQTVGCMRAPLPQGQSAQLNGCQHRPDQQGGLPDVALIWTDEAVGDMLRSSAGGIRGLRIRLFLCLFVKICCTCAS